MPLSVHVTITGTEEEIAKLQKLGDSFNEFGDAMKTIGGELVRYYSGQVFASQGGILDEDWPDLSDRYSKKKAKDYPGRGILVKTGDMQNQFRFDASNDSVVMSNAASYFPYHQSSEPRSKMPYRPMMLVNDDVRSIVGQIIQADIEEKIAAVT